MLEWFKKKPTVKKREDGISEMKQATQRKLEVAKNILDRRKEDRRSDPDRRNNPQADFIEIMS